MKRRRAVELTEQVLTRAVSGAGEWPLDTVREIYVFGSFARGAPEPGDGDLDVEVDTGGTRWLEELLQALSERRDMHAVLRRALVGRGRSVQLQVNRHDTADYPMTLLWRAGEDLDTALARVYAIAEDPTAGPAPRHAMLPQFAGIDRWAHRAHREHLEMAIRAGAIEVQRLSLPDSDDPADDRARDFLRSRWKPTSPLYRAGRAVFAHFAAHDVDLGQVHLHGRDVDEAVTPYFAGFNLKYFRCVPRNLTVHEGQEWIDVVHPRATGDIDALRITPVDLSYLRDAEWEID